MNLDRFEQTGIVLTDGEIFANRKQILDLYNVPKNTLSDNISQLKKDGLIVGAKIRPKSGRSYEIYDFEEVISIGLRLRSDKAIEFQRWARNVIKNELIALKEIMCKQQYQLDYFWDKEDQKDLYS